MDYQPRIRSIQQAVVMIKQSDPETEISEYLVRKLANNGEIRSIKSGNKVMVDYDSLLAYICGRPYQYDYKQIVLSNEIGG